jgi:hypothetical protein
MLTSSNALAFYASPGPLSDAGPFADRFDRLPTAIPELVTGLQTLQVHAFWTEHYGLQLADERRAEVNLRPLRLRLERMLALDDRPFDQPRPLERRLVSNCRDFSLTLVGVLRARGIPAIARPGFGTYFTPGKYEDHWIVQVWEGERWRGIDPQIDDAMRTALQLDFDPLDVPPGRFVTGGEAWLLCRQQGIDPDLFGIFEYKGWDFVRGNLLRDLLALNKLELLPWDFWGLLSGSPVAACPPELLEAHDRLAEALIPGREAFPTIRDAYRSDPDVQIPPEWLEETLSPAT